MVALSSRERDVVELLARGLDQEEIAVVLGIGEASVKTYAGGAYRKLGARNAAHAVARHRERELAQTVPTVKCRARVKRAWIAGRLRGRDDVRQMLGWK